MNNDFHNTYDLFELFKDLTVKDLDVEVPADSAAAKPELNGTSKQNGDAKEPNGTSAEVASKN